MNEMRSSNFNAITWFMEMECMFYGESENAFFSYDDLAAVRTLKPHSMIYRYINRLIQSV